MASKHWRIVLAASVAVVLVTAGSVNRQASAQQTGQTNPSLMIKSVAGRDLFEFYCATCHGRDGKGAGPVAAALHVPPSDLTTIARTNGGTFPRSRVEAILIGPRAMPPAHGSREMPIWGPIFGALDSNDTLNRVRIGNVVDYIASIQIK